MTNAGIDYGMGTSNVDHTTGIRYGVISQHSVGQAWYDAAEADYGKPTCPKCGNEVHAVDSVPADSEWDMYDGKPGCADFACETCEHFLDAENCYGDEPIGWNVDEDGYELTDCLDSDIFVLKSPFYTFGSYCSPCVPGAVNLDDAHEDGAKAYCLGHDWFEHGKAPYRVFRVSDDSEVLPE